MPQFFSRQLSVLLPVVIASAGVVGGAAAQTGNVAHVQAVRPDFVGRWQLDLARMPNTYGTPPKQVIYTFENVGAGTWRTTIDITAPDGGVRHSTVTYRLDGSPVRGEGDTIEADSAAVMAPAPNIFVINLAKNKMPRSVRVYTLSANGGEMTETASAVNDEGAPYIRTFHFRRLP